MPYSQMDSPTLELLTNTKRDSLILLLHNKDNSGYLARFNEVINGGTPESTYADTSKLFEISPVNLLEDLSIPQIRPLDIRGVPNLNEYSAYIGKLEIRNAFSTTPWLAPYDALMQYCERPEERPPIDFNQIIFSLD